MMQAMSDVPRRRWYAALPVVGRPLLEALHPEEITWRRYGEKEDRPRRLRAQALSLFTILTGTGYLVWVSQALNHAHPLVGAGFFASEAACLLLFTLAASSLWRLRFKPAESPTADRTYSVDVFVPVCGEALPVVAKTLRAAKAIRWDGPLHLFVLDDGASPAVEALTRELGITYLSRRQAGVPLADAKAGNLNFGLAHSSSELLLVLDADQVPRPEILEALAGYFRFPRLAFVQSRQAYLVPDGDPFFNEDRVFYGAVQLALDHHDTPISCGSGVVYRRAALDDIGGFATWNLVEDLTTSYELHAHDWKSFYYPYPLTEGLAPEDVWGVYRQRGQWALDTMRLFFWDQPLFKRGLGVRKRLNYFLIGFTYLTVGFAIPFLFLIPPWTYVTGQVVLERSPIEFVFARGLYFAAMALALRYLAFGERPGRQFQMLVGYFPIYTLGTLRALRYPRSKPAYRANNREKAGRRRWAVTAILPQLAIISANLFLPLYAAFAETAPAGVLAVNALVSAVAVWTLWTALEAAVTEHRWSSHRHPMQVYGIPNPS
jgi:cellulose synthase (UDP-forming)